MKSKRIMISLEPQLVEYIDGVCGAFNKDVTEYADQLTRSKFIALCVLAYYDAMIHEEKQKATN